MLTDAMCTDESGLDPEQHYQKWKTLAPLGLLATGLGASALGQSTLLKGRDEPLWRWVAAGTASLAILNGGLCLFGDAVKHRALYEWGREEDRRTRSDRGGSSQRGLNEDERTRDEGA